MDFRLFSTSKIFRHRYRRKKRKKTEEQLLKELEKKITPKVWIWEFSKRILLVLTVLYCVERIYAMVMMAVAGNMDYITVFLETGKEVFKAGVIFYALKAGIENTLKIALSNKGSEETDGLEEQEEFYE